MAAVCRRRARESVGEDRASGCRRGRAWAEKVAEVDRSAATLRRRPSRVAGERAPAATVARRKASSRGVRRIRRPQRSGRSAAAFEGRSGRLASLLSLDVGQGYAFARDASPAGPISAYGASPHFFSADLLAQPRVSEQPRISPVSSPTAAGLSPRAAKFVRDPPVHHHGRRRLVHRLRRHGSRRSVGARGLFGRLRRQSGVGPAVAEVRPSATVSRASVGSGFAVGQVPGRPWHVSDRLRLRGPARSAGVGVGVARLRLRVGPLRKGCRGARRVSGGIGSGVASFDHARLVRCPWRHDFRSALRLDRRRWRGQGAVGRAASKCRLGVRRRPRRRRWLGGRHGRCRLRLLGRSGSGRIRWRAARGQASETSTSILARHLESGAADRRGSDRAMARTAGALTGRRRSPGPARHACPASVAPGLTASRRGCSGPPRRRKGRRSGSPGRPRAARRSARNGCSSATQ